MGGVFYQGLDYPSIEAFLECEFPKRKRQLFQQIRLLEAGAVSEINGQNVSDNAAHSG